MTQEPELPTGGAAEEVGSLCEQGQRLLMATEYCKAERALAQAEQIAWQQRDFDALARLYMPLQEARRQRRQRCAEGVIRLDLIAQNADDVLDAKKIVEGFPTGQLLVAGWMSLQPAQAVRELAYERCLYLDTFLAAAFPAAVGAGSQIIMIVPLSGVRLDVLYPPAQSVVISRAEIPPSGQAAWVAQMWQRLHLPFLAAADQQTDPVRKIDAYRKTIAVDYACELAHQKLADTARALTIRPHARQA